MSSIIRQLSLVTVAVSLFVVGGCSAAPDDPDSDDLVGASEEVDARSDGLSGPVAAGSKLTSTANVNLRTGASTNYQILHVVPLGSQVTVVESTPNNGFYKISHNGTVGWSYGQYYKTVDSGGSGDSSDPSLRAQAIERAKSGKGFSYWWGHGRFKAEGPTSSTAGSCSGSCPNCSHSGSYGGDCSGLVGKVWQVPSSNSELNVDSHPYSTVSFNSDTSQWSSVPRANVKKADAMVYNTNGAGHIFVYDSGDGWNQMYAYECKGCSYGCIAGYRTASSAYHAITRKGY
jgi:hypothetical protein